MQVYVPFDALMTTAAFDGAIAELRELRAAMPDDYSALGCLAIGAVADVFLRCCRPSPTDLDEAARERDACHALFISRGVPPVSR